MKQSTVVDMVMAMMREVNMNENRVSLPTLYIKMFDGDVTTALIAQECEWYSALKDDGWFYMRQEDWHKRYCFSRRGVDRAFLELGGIVERKVKRAPDGDAATYLKFNNRRMFGRIFNYMRSQNMAKDLLERARTLGFAVTGKTPPNVQNEQSGLYIRDQSYNRSRLQNQATDSAADAANLLPPRKTTPIISNPPHSAEEAKTRIRAALDRGLNGNATLTAAIEYEFHIQPNWDTKTNRAALLRLRENGATPEQVATVKRAWDATNGRNGYVPAISQIVEFWPSAFASQQSPDAQRLNEKKAALRRQGIG